jgi:transcriptional regulator with XRE-family HTH domain
MNFGDRLRSLIEEQGITQKELANKLNVSPSTLGNYIQNTREPDFATLRRFAEYFSVSTDYLLCHHSDDYICESAVDYNSDGDDLLRIFLSLTSEQQEIYLEQGKVFVRYNQKRK